MSMVISTNMSALNTTNQLNKNSALMNSSLQKLSSGYSINSASDNAAGLAISEKMRAQIQGLDQASDNTQDATSLAQTADGALDTTTSILKRMRELAVQASSDTLTDSDRTSIQDEVDQLRQEIDRISDDTEYNTKKLLNGDCGASTAVSGTNSSAVVAASTSAGNNTQSGTYSVVYDTVATQATTGLSTSTTGITSADASATKFAGDISINGTTITIASGDTITGVLQKINDETDTTGVTATLDTTTTGNYYIKLTDDTYGSSSSITLKAANSTLTGLFNATADSTATSVTVTGTNATGKINGAVATASGNTLTAFDLTVTGNDTTLTNIKNGITTFYANSGTSGMKLSSGLIKTASQVTIKASALKAAASGIGSTASKITAAASSLLATTVGTTAYNTAYTTLANVMASNTDTTLAGDYAKLTAADNAYDTINTMDTAASGMTVGSYITKYGDATATVNVDASTTLTFQVGANSNQTMTLSISDMDATSLGVAGDTSTTGIDLSSASKATTAITTIDSAISKVSSERSNLGAVENSLSSNGDDLDTESENLTSAESNIRDTDMASEMAEYTKLSVITQAATAMLAKANQQPQQVLTLLQG